MAERDRETIVTTDGGGGGGTIIAVVVLLVVVVAILFFVFRGNLMGGGTDKIDADVKIDTPAPNGNGG
jgi:hypothetical protein